MPLALHMLCVLRSLGSQVLLRVLDWIALPRLKLEPLRPDRNAGAKKRIASALVGKEKGKAHAAPVRALWLALSNRDRFQK